MAEDQGASASTSSADPEDEIDRLRDMKLVDYVRINLAEAKADTAQMQAELEHVKELKLKLLDDLKQTLKLAGLPILSDGMNPACPGLNKVSLKTDQMIFKLGNRILAKSIVDDAYACHSMKLTLEDFERRFDHCTPLTEEKVTELIDQLKVNFDKTYSIKEELDQKKKEFYESLEAVLDKMAAMSQAEPDVIQHIEFLQLKKKPLEDVTPD